jgi:hypothetical protein
MPRNAGEISLARAAFAERVDQQLDAGTGMSLACCGEVNSCSHAAAACDQYRPRPALATG